MDISRMIEFLETDRLSVTFTLIGLKYLSLKGDKGEQVINLNNIDKEDKNSKEYLLVRETFNFLETGSHKMQLDITGFTPFKQSVFKAISEIKRGQILNYKDVAEMIGNIGAAQAVGSAVAKNPVSYFLPTHRVLPKKGIGICKSGAGFIREKLLILEGHDVEKLKGNYFCDRKKCCME